MPVKEITRTQQSGGGNSGNRLFEQTQRFFIQNDYQLTPSANEYILKLLKKSRTRVLISVQASLASQSKTRGKYPTISGRKRKNPHGFRDRAASGSRRRVYAQITRNKSADELLFEQNYKILTQRILERMDVGVRKQIKSSDIDSALKSLCPIWPFCQ